MVQQLYASNRRQCHSFTFFSRSSNVCLSAHNLDRSFLSACQDTFNSSSLLACLLIVLYAWFWDSMKREDVAARICAELMRTGYCRWNCSVTSHHKLHELAACDFCWSQVNLTHAPACMLAQNAQPVYVCCLHSAHCLQHHNNKFTSYIGIVYTSAILKGVACPQNVATAFIPSNMAV